jgi:transcriptional regulator with XRE-family HTH domain
MSIHQEIRRLRLAKGWSHQQVAQEVSKLEGASKVLAWQTVQQWEKPPEEGGTAPKRARLAYVARALGTTVESLIADDLNPHRLGVAHDMSHARPTLPIRRIAWEALMEANLNQPFELEVIDDALAPEIYRGCIARLDPSRTPVAGRPVLVRDSSGNHYLRDFQQGPGGSWQAVARQRGYAPLDSAADGLTVIATLKGVDWP